MPDENKDAVIEIFNLTAQGLKPKEICPRVSIIRKVKCKKIKVNLSLTTYKRIIRNKFYIGLYKFRDKEIMGNYPIFISEDLFNKINKN